MTEYVTRPDGKDLVRVTVTVETESQRAIVIGKGGAALKQLSMAARHGIEDFLGTVPPFERMVCTNNFPQYNNLLRARMDLDVQHAI